MNSIKQTGFILDQIVQARRLRLERNMTEITLAEIRERATESKHKPADFRSALLKAAKIGIIAEIKRSSPSCGTIMADLQPGELALAYQAAGVQAISVLTEEDYFAGSRADFEIVRSSVSLPLLRKDFIIDPWQIYESSIMGASAILLICAILDDFQLNSFLAISHELSMAAVVEVHDLSQLMRALSSGARIIGINNRDLQTFRTDLKITEGLAGLIPADRLVIAESGIRDAFDLARVYRAGAHAALIGESLVRVSAAGQDIPGHFINLRRELPI